jgi:hypothetical protein
MVVAQKHKCMPGDVRCDGCRAVHAIGWNRDEDRGKNCGILAYLKPRNIETCGGCDKPGGCARWRQLADEYLGLDVSLKANLDSIKMVLNAWLQAQEERWHCRQCGRSVVVDSLTPRCRRCGTFQLWQGSCPRS